MPTHLPQNQFISNSDAHVASGSAAANSCPPPPAAADDLTDCINEIFFYARKLMKQPPRFILDEGRFLAEIEEVPLFIREDGYLKRQA
jgi:hypothetical protein